MYTIEDYAKLAKLHVEALEKIKFLEQLCTDLRQQLTSQKDK